MRGSNQAHFDSDWMFKPFTLWYLVSFGIMSYQNGNYRPDKDT